MVWPVIFQTKPDIFDLVCIRLNVFSKFFLLHLSPFKNPADPAGIHKLHWLSRMGAAGRTGVMALTGKMDDPAEPDKVKVHARLGVPLSRADACDPGTPPAGPGASGTGSGT
jgi:hypothetical protein